MLDLIIPTAMAEGQAAAQQGGAGVSLMMLVVFVIIFYFMLWRPQSKRAKEHQKMVEALKAGDEVIISGGILGKLTHVGDEQAKLSIAQGVEITVQKHAIAAVLPKGTIKKG